MASELEERLLTELSLLEAMYAEQVEFKAKGRELIYTTAHGAGITLRIPDGYLETDLPEVLSASAANADMRDAIKARVKSCESGVEILDSILSSFDELAEAVEVKAHSLPEQNIDQETKSEASATVIIWLHHLLNTNKRKLALSPSSLSGITKPGYPGVLVYSGPAKAVHEHVNELKAQNWAAFQVRYQSDDLWAFAHGTGIVEVETMKEVVADICEERKEEFMEAMRMK